MANYKKGLDYFPHDTDMSSADQQLELIEAEFGLKGYAIYLKLLEKIYGENGYYMEWNKDIKLLFARRVSEKGALVEEVINGLLRRGLFNKSVLESSGVLTSKAIQTRYLDATKRREKVDLNAAFLLIPPNAYNKYGNVNIIEGDVNISKQSRVEKSKEEESREEEGVGTSGSDEFPDACKYLDEAREIAQHLLESIIAWKPDHKYAANPPSINRWILDIERMIRLDDRDPDKIWKLIDYTFTKNTRQAQFWAKNVWSGEKLRDQYDRMASDYNSELENNRNGTNRKTKGDRRFEILREHGLSG